MIDIRKLKELVRLMVANDLTELDLRDSEEQVTLRRGPSNGAAAVPTVVHAAPAATPAAGATPGSAVADTAAPEPADAEAGLLRIESPMVGTFYSAPDPESASYVEVGGRVGPETVVCLVEAMKIFNEIKAECTGTVHRVCVENGQAIEFGQVLFLVKGD